MFNSSRCIKGTHWSILSTHSVISPHGNSSNKMFCIVLAIILAAVGAESKMVLMIGPTWNNEVSACWSGGAHELDYSTYVGKLTNYNITFRDIRIGNTAVLAEGAFKLKTGKEGWQSRGEFSLSEFSQPSTDLKLFKGHYGLTTGWQLKS